MLTHPGTHVYFASGASFVISSNTQVSENSIIELSANSGRRIVTLVLTPAGD